MNVLGNIVLDMQRPGYAVIYAVQFDKLSRQITAQLTDKGLPWTVPTGALMTIRYSKPDGTQGFYDTLEDGTKAYTVSGSTVTITLAQQALAAAGNVLMQLNFYTAAGAALSTFSFVVTVQPSVLNDAEIVSSDYYNVLTGLMTDMAEQYAEFEQLLKAGYGAPLKAATAAAMTDKNKIYVYTGSESGYTSGHWYYWNGTAWTDGGVYNAVAFTTDTTLTIAGAAADAKATGDQLGNLKSDFSFVNDVVAMSLDTTNIINGFPSITFGNTVSYTNSQYTKSIVNIVKVKPNTKYIVTVDNSNGIASAGVRKSVIVDANNIVKQVIESNTTNEQFTVVRFVSRLDGYLVLALQSNYAGVTIEEDKNIDIDIIRNAIGTVNWYPDPVDLPAVTGSTEANCIGIKSEGNTFVLNGDNTFGGALRATISYNVYRYATVNSLRTGAARMPMKNGHQYRLCVDYIAGETTANLFVIVRDNENHDIVSCRPGNDNIFTWTDGEGYMFLYAAAGSFSFTDYIIKVWLIDETEALYQLYHRTQECYKIANKFSHTEIYRASSVDDRTRAQGMCTDGTYLYIAMLLGSGDNTGRIIKLTTEGSIVLQNNIADVGHLNQLAYDPLSGYILAVGSASPIVYRFNKDTLSLVDTLTLTNVQTALANKSDKTGFWAIAYVPEHDVWVIGNTACYAITNNDFSIIHRVVLQKTSGDGQGLYPFGDVVYSSFWGGNKDFSVYDWHGRKIKDFNMSVPTYREFEGIAQIGGDFYTYWNLGGYEFLVTKMEVLYHEYIPVAEIAGKFFY